MKDLLKEWKEFLIEEFDKDKFPFPDTASQEEADAIFTGGFKDGDPDDDKIVINKNAPFTCQQLNPSQKEVRVTDAVEFGMWMLEGKYEIGGNLGAIVSSDDFIMDGHHRWAGSWLAGGPQTKMTAVQVGLPKDELIPVLAAVGDHFHPGKRNPGATGGVANIFDAPVDEVGKYIRRLNEEDNITKYMTKAEANAITEMVGGIDALIEKFEKHAAQLKEQKGGGVDSLPPRDEMPVIKKAEVEPAVDALAKGQVDVYTPYRKEMNEAEPAKGTGKKPKGSTRRLYTDENPSDTVPIKFKTVSDVQDTLSRSDYKSKSHARKSQIIQVIKQRACVAAKNAKNADTKARLNKVCKYATKRAEAHKKK